MLKTTKLALPLLFLWFFLCCSEQKPGAENISATPYTLKIPSNLGAMPIPEHNPLSKEGVALGKMLFHDPRLSANHQISCASCHQPSLAFSDGLALSHAGQSQQRLTRHVPQLTNVGWNKSFFWDGGAKNLESMVFGPLTHPDEMGQNLTNLISQLQQDELYPRLFAQAFGTDSIQAAYLARSLAQYMRTLLSANSPYDQYIRGEKHAALSKEALLGMALFEEKCASCHTFGKGENDYFTDFSFHNIGLDSVYSEDEERVFMGRYRITYDSMHIGAFKTPTLRNVAVTPPYMHDGRFATLEEVLEHYSSGVKLSYSLDTRLRAEENLGIALEEDEKKALISFLNTLTDTSFISQTIP